MSEVYVKSSKYGKQQVKFLKKVISPEDPKKHTVYEYTTLILLEGDFDDSYTKADNSLVIPTDTQKNSVYILAKLHEFTEPEVFASIVANHFVTKKGYEHVSAANCEVISHRWSRAPTSAGLHAHSFYRDGEEIQTAKVRATRGGDIKITSGLKDLLILKSTGSAFHGYHTDEWTTLQETHDRIFSTMVDCTYVWSSFKSLDDVTAASDKFAKAFDGSRTITLETFATDDSASVQATMYKMCEQIIGKYSDVMEVEYTLPNKHYFEISMAPFGIENTGADATVYAPQAWPSGYINACVARKV